MPQWFQCLGVNLSISEKAFDRRKSNFKSEWFNTLGYLHSIQRDLSNHRPSWVDETVPAGWQVDQFLHAYYYNRLGDKINKPYEESYRHNKSNPSSALKAEFKWWETLSEAPTNEDVTLYKSAPVVQTLLARDKILKLTVEEFESLCRKIHATLDHVIKVPLEALGKPELQSIDREGRLKLFASMVMKERNKKGWDIRQLLDYVLYSGNDRDIWERIYHAGRDGEYRIPRFGLNSIAEVVGWARPELVPPRNARTSKALRALGFDVKVY